MVKILKNMVFCLSIVVCVLALSDNIGATEFELFGRASSGDHMYHNEIPFKVYYEADYWSVAVRVDSVQTNDTFDDLIGKRGTSLHMLTFLGNAQEVPDKTKVAEVIVHYLDETAATIDLIAGFNTAEWAWDRPGDWFFKHSKPAPGYSWVEGDGEPPEISSVYGKYMAHMYYVKLPIECKPLDFLELRWTAGTQYDPESGAHSALWLNALTLANAPWRELSSGFGHTVAIKSDGTLWAWGDNLVGQLGDNKENNSLYPKKIGNDKDWVKVSAGTYHTAAIKSDGTLWAWGSNYEGQLGDGTRGEGSRIPKKVGNETDWVDVSAGMKHTIAIKSDGTLWSWGDNESGQLGDGTNNPSYKPKLIGDDQAWVVVAAGDHNSFGIKSNGSLWAWGINESGQLGDGSTNPSFSPKQIGDVFDNWIKVSPHSTHTCGVKSKNYKTEDFIIHNTTLWSWGNNYHGQLGDGTTESRLVPKLIGDSENWVGASSGGGHTLGKISDSTLWAWGDNESGQLGDGTTNKSNFPKQIGVDADWEMVEAGILNSFAVKSDSTLWAWGSNYDGRLGDGTEIDRHEPVKIFPPKPKIVPLGAIFTLMNSE